MPFHPHEHSSHSYLVSILLIVFGILWLTWLYRLRANPRSESDESNKRCHQVDPTTRSTLLVFAWLLLLSSAWFLCMRCVEGIYTRTVSVVPICLYLVFIIIFSIQIGCLRYMSVNKTLVRRGCTWTTQWNAVQYSLVGFAIIMMVVGVWGMRGIFV